jgi:serine/threonine-protein kinase
VGIVLYEMLTGRLPFDGESAVTIALKQVNEAPIPPSAFNGAVTPELEGVVLHALEKQPAHRFPDADAFILALDRARIHIEEGSPEGNTAAFAPVYDGDGVPAGEERSRRPWWIALVVAIAVLAAAAVAYALTRPSEHTVPNVTGKPVQAALAVLQNAGFDPSIERTTSDAPVDRVIRQDPQPGEKAKDGSEVTLTVSQGPGNRAVPDVVGRSRDSAVKALEKAGFKVRERRRTSASVADGDVISTTPPAATQVQIGSTITLVVSKGPAQVAVPDVVGQPSDSARAALSNAGFAVAVAEQENDKADPGTVLAQDPAAGTRLAKGETVTLTVAKQPQDVTVPDVVGQSANDAVNALSDAGVVPQQATKTVSTRIATGSSSASIRPPDAASSGARA